MSLRALCVVDGRDFSFQDHHTLSPFPFPCCAHTSCLGGNREECIMVCKLSFHGGEIRQPGWVSPLPFSFFFLPHVIHWLVSLLLAFLTSVHDSFPLAMTLAVKGKKIKITSIWITSVAVCSVCSGEVYSGRRKECTFHESTWCVEGASDANDAERGEDYWSLLLMFMISLVSCGQLLYIIVQYNTNNTGLGQMY